LADGKEYFDFADFSRVKDKNPKIFNWLSKPEKAMNMRVKEYGR